MRISAVSAAAILVVFVLIVVTLLLSSFVIANHVGTASLVIDPQSFSLAANYCFS